MWNVNVKVKRQLVFSNLFVTVSYYSPVTTPITSILNFSDEIDYFIFYYYITVNISLYLDSSTLHTPTGRLQKDQWCFGFD